MPEVPSRPPIAVVGVSALFPGSQDATGFWRDIVAGRDLVTDVPATHWLIEDYFDADPSAPDKTYARRGAFLSPVEFDPLEHGIPPSILPATDTTQLLALIAANQVLEDAIGSQFTHVSREKTSVILGATSALELVGTMTSRLQKPVWLNALREHGIPEDEAQRICERISGSYVPWQESTFPGLLGNVVAGRIANRLNLGGTNCVADAACASALSALAMATNELHLGLSDLVITGGADTFNDIFMYMCFSKTPALSPTGDCRPFSAAADGTLLGEGIGLFALRRLEDAERDGDRIYAVIRGVGSGSDGRAKSIYAPLPEGQARALRRAYEAAGYGPETVELVEAHGTGTKAGDVAEFEGLRQVFEANGRADRQWCALGSVKSQIGHTKAAAGAAGLFKAVMALHHKALPPTLKVDQPNPALDMPASAFYLNTRTRPWIRDGAHPRRASVSSFGFGGSNFHVTLEEYTGPNHAFRLRTAPSELVLLCADDAAGLAQACQALAADERPLAQIARASLAAFDASKPARAAIVADTVADLRGKLGRAAAAEAPVSTPDGVHVGHGPSSGPLAFLFPGQGSQYVEMGADLAVAFDAARAVWDAAAPLRLHERVFPRPVFSAAEREALEKELTATEWAQPAIGAASLAQLAVLEKLGLAPAACAGHSFGEITALAAAGSLTPAHALSVARLRGELMAAAADRPGAMIAVVAARADVEPLLAEWGDRVVVANHNAPKQVVLSGETAAIDEIAARLADRGVTVRRLAVSTAFHSPIVAPAAEAFAAYLSEVPFEAPRVPVYANSSAAAYGVEASAIRATLASQITSPVRFVEEIEALYAAGLRTFVEVGPGGVLTRLVGEILGDRPHVAVATDRKGQHGVTALHHALARLAAAGVRFDAAQLFADVAPVKDASRRRGATITLTGANYGKPYPPKGGAASRPAPVLSRPQPPVALPAPDPVPTPVAAAPKPAPAPPAPAASVAADPAWLATFAQIQQQTAEAHASWQQAMADAHGAFLRATETSFQALASIVGGQPLPTGLPAALAAPVPALAPVVAPPAPAPAPVVAPPARVAPAPVAVAVAAKVAPAPRAADPAAALLAVVAEKTGYPADMLNLDMELEADLGIDSIKRVEILSGLQERTTGLPDVAPADMARLRTLRQIVERLGAAAPVAAPALPPAPVEPAPPARPVREVLLAVVAEKTGYPAEMLELRMELEADLGIDSIKRVEILSTLQDRVPALPDVKPAEMAQLRTLQQIVERLEGAPVAAAKAAPAAPARDLAGLLLAVVAEKTGYPADALGLGMELEADLGIDSIKRVEILSALQERVPGLPELPPARMAGLRTLQNVVDMLSGGPVPVAAPVPAASDVPSPVPHPALPVGRYQLHAVPAPPSGLGLAGLLTAGPVAVVPDERGIADVLVERLTALGVDARVAQEPDPAFGAVIHLGALSEADPVAVQSNALMWAKALAPRATAGPAALVTVHDAGGDFGLSGLGRVQAWVAGLPGLVKTAAQEWPLAGVKSIDVDIRARDAHEVSDVVLAELLAGGPELEVGLLSDGQRLRPESVADRSTAGDDSVLNDLRGKPVVVSGGARGVTVACLEALARAAAPRLVLLGRTAEADEPECCRAAPTEAAVAEALLAEARGRGESPTPAELRGRVHDVLSRREIAAALDTLRKAGSEVRYVACDVRDKADVQRVLADVRRDWGPIAGLVHAAGVLADKLIADKTAESFERVFTTKVMGLRALLEATAPDPLRAIVLFSSVAGRAGNAGQSDYAMANEVLNKMAQAEAQRRGRKCLVRAIGWGPWDGGMVTPALRARFENAGVPLVDRATGARLFVDELRRPLGDAEVVIGGAPRPQPLVSASGKRHACFELLVSAATHPHLRDHAVSGVPVVPAALVVEWMASAAAAVRPDLHLVRLEDVRVLRGVRLEDFERGQVLRLTCREVANGSRSRLALELQAADGTPHYSALADLEPEPPAAGAAVPEMAGADVDLGRAYGGALFHGPRFRALLSARFAPQGASARLAGARELGWPAPGARTDPAAVDGAVQLALLWAAQELGRRSLPTHVAAVIVHEGGPPTRCVLVPRERGAHRTLGDVLLADESGRCVVELRGLEMHAIGDGMPAVLGPELAADTASA
jgi:acyl transferase domain-containing protein